MNSSQSSYLQPATFAADNLIHISGWLYMMQDKLLSKTITGISLVVRIFLPENIDIQNPQGQAGTIPRKEIFHIMILPNQIIGFDEEESYQVQNTDSTTGSELDHEAGISYRSSIDLIQRFMKDRQSPQAKQELDAFIEKTIRDIEKEGFELDEFDEITDKNLEDEEFRQEIRDRWQALPGTEQKNFQHQHKQLLTATSGKFIRKASYWFFKDQSLTLSERIGYWNKLLLDERLPYLYHEFLIRKQKRKK